MEFRGPRAVARTVLGRLRSGTVAGGGDRYMRAPADRGVAVAQDGRLARITGVQVADERGRSRPRRVHILVSVAYQPVSARYARIRTGLLARLCPRLAREWDTHLRAPRAREIRSSVLMSGRLFDPLRRECRQALPSRIHREGLTLRALE